MTYQILTTWIMGIGLVVLAACDGSSSNRSADEQTLVNPDRSNESRDQKLQSCYRGDELICAIEAEIVAQTNQLRAENGLSQVEQSFEVSYVARLWSEQQATSKQISHQGFPEQRQRQLSDEFAGWQTFLLAENVAMGMPQSKDPEVVAQYIVSLWADSAGHRRNMLGPYQYLGTGIHFDGEHLYATQIFHN